MNQSRTTSKTVTTLAPTLIRLQEIEASALSALRHAETLHREAAQALCAAQHQEILASIEARRLESLANAAAYPDHWDSYMAEAIRHASAYAILSSPTSPTEAAV